MTFKKSNSILRKGIKQAIYKFIDKHKTHIRLRWLLKQCGVYANGYYNYLRNNIRQSVNKLGCPYVNAVMERLFRAIKFELINRFQFNNDKQLETAISEYVFGFYNQLTPHASYGYKPPN